MKFLLVLIFLSSVVLADNSKNDIFSLDEKLNEIIQNLQQENLKRKFFTSQTTKKIRQVWRVKEAALQKKIALLEDELKNLKEYYYEASHYLEYSVQQRNRTQTTPSFLFPDILHDLKRCMEELRDRQTNITKWSEDYKERCKDLETWISTLKTNNTTNKQEIIKPNFIYGELIAFQEKNGLFRLKGEAPTAGQTLLLFSGRKIIGECKVYRVMQKHFTAQCTGSIAKGIEATNAKEVTVK